MNLFRKFRALFRKEKLDADMAEEMRAHLELQAAENEKRGMSADEARYAAQRAFGGVEQIKERARDQRGTVWLEHLKQDLAYGLRQMRKHPGFTAIVVLILGLGIGANTAVFSAIEVLLLRSLPVRAPEELVLVTNVRMQGQAGAVASAYLSYEAFEWLRDRAQSLAGVLALNGSGGSRMLLVPGSGRTEPVRVKTSDVSGSYFSVLQVAPALGRLIAPEDDQKGAPRAVAVLSHGFWQRQFGGERGVIGKTVLIENVAFEIIGVTPEGFDGVKIGEPIEVWTPLWMMPAVNPRFGKNLSQPAWNGLHLMARLRPGVTRAAATAEADLMFQQIMMAARPEVAAGDRARVWGGIDLAPGAGGYAGDARSQGGPILGILLVVVVLVQVIACANVAGLSLARLAARQRELAARTALGAGRGRIVRQLLTESALLVAGGVLVGAVLVQWGFFAARANGIDARPSGWILLFGLLVAVVTGVIVALVPALKSSRIDLISALKNQGNALAGGGRSRLQQALVVIQLAVCGCLLTGTGYFVRTIQYLRSVDPGFRGEKLLFVAVETPRDYDASRRNGVTQELLRAIRAWPGVAHATVSQAGLLGDGTSQGSIAVDGYAPRPQEDMTVRFVFAGPNYFEAIGVPLVRGHDFQEADVFSASRPPVGKAVINEAVARRFFGDADPTGRRFRWGKPEFEIIGVARNTKYRSLREESPLICYVPLPPDLSSPLIGLQVRAVGQPQALASSMAAVVKQIDPNARVRSTQTMADVLQRATAEESMTAFGIGAFSLLALLLTSLGLYGMLAYNVAQRTREIGVRIALGGQAGDIIGMILKQGLVLTAAGWVIGIVAAMGLVRFVASRLYGVSGADPATLIASGLGLAIVAVLACWLPARRATKIDPMIALRSE